MAGLRKSRKSWSPSEAFATPRARRAMAVVCRDTATSKPQPGKERPINESCLCFLPTLHQCPAGASPRLSQEQAGGHRAWLMPHGRLALTTQGQMESESRGAHGICITQDASEIPPFLSPTHFISTSNSISQSLNWRTSIHSIHCHQSLSLHTHTDQEGTDI